MSIKQWIVRLIPKFILHGLLQNRDRKQLATVSKQECNPKNLRHWTADQVAGFFSCPDSDRSWQKIQTRLNQFTIQDMTGGVNPGDRRAIFYLASALQATKVLEIGTHIGASTIHLASALKMNAERSGASPVLTSVDVADVNDPVRQPWRQYGSESSPVEMLRAIGCDSFVEFETCRSLDYLKECDQSFDLIFLDGDHSARTTYLEIPQALKRLKPGGTILLHDYFPNLKPLWSKGNLIPGPHLAAQRLINEGNSLAVIPLGDLPWPTKLDSCRTSLALLTTQASNEA